MSGMPVSNASLHVSEHVDAERLLASIDVLATLDARFLRLTSGAFHDVRRTACPTAMPFVPSRDGISHNPAETTDPHHLAMGARALAHCVTQLCND